MAAVGLLGHVPVAATAPGPRGRSISSGARRARQGDLLIRGGTVVNADGRRRADVLVRGEAISAVGPALDTDDAHVLEADGLLVLPGGIDPHTHLFSPFVDDFASGTRAALAGGITTVGSFAFQRGAEQGLLDILETQAAAARTQASSDVILHVGFWPPTERQIDQIPRLAAAGHTSIKLFMLRGDFEARVPEVLRLLETARDHGVLTMLHCEDAALLDHAVRRLSAEGRTTLRYYPESRPVVAEVVATQRAAALCEATDAPVYVVHLSCARALEACVEARRRRLPFFVESRPLYLHLTEEVYAGPDGPLYVGQPPIRSQADQDALWEGLRSGAIDVIGTDHAPWTRADKMDPARSITDLRPGVNNLQAMLPMLFSEGVGKGRITVERFVQLTSRNPARLFGLYPRKGVVDVGADADIVLWDPGVVGAIRGEDGYSKAGFSLYEGWEVTGWPVLVLRRGEVVAEHGRVSAEPGSGRVLERGPSVSPEGP